MKWTSEEIEKSKDLLKSGKSFLEISKDLGRSKSSIRNKMNKSGFNYKDFNPSTETKCCKECNNEFESKKFEERLFCNHSCSASYNIKHKPRKDHGNCLCCNLELRVKDSKYCNIECHVQHKRDVVFNKIESGDISLSSKSYKKYLIHKHGNKCMECGWNEINPISKRVPIELEHIDGNSENNNLNNLKLLCPN